MSYFSDIQQELIALIESGVSAPVTLDYVYEEDSDKAVIISDMAITYDNNFSMDNLRKTMSFSLGVVANTHDDLNAILSEIDALNGASGTDKVRYFIVDSITYGMYNADTFSADVSCEVELYG